MKKIVVCPDSFKGTMTAGEAAQAMRNGILQAIPDAEVVTLPLGDGGEGTVTAIASVLPHVETVECPSVDPLGRPLTASYAIADGKMALIESAAASGLTLIKQEERDVMKSDSSGTGLLIADAYRRGIRDFIICMGGTATCDGGIGAFRAMENIVPLAAEGNREQAPGFTLLCDVDNPFCGARGAAAVFAPQKGASPDMIPRLEAQMKETAAFYRKLSGTDVSLMKYAGAAGGIAGMLMACFGAKPVAGIGKVLELLRFGEQIRGASLIITGEGKADSTTLSGKAPMGILGIAKEQNIPVALVCGRISDRDLLLSEGFSYTVQASPEGTDPRENPAGGLTEAVRQLMIRLRI